MRISKSFSAILLTVVVLCAGCFGDDGNDVFYGEDISPPIPVDEFILTDEKGEYFAMSQYEGKVVVIAFLFTRCPDICPVVSANLAFVAEELGDLYGTQVEILTITVDPWTDNSSVLENYAGTRGLSWPHLTGNLDDLEPIWQNFDVGLTTYSTDEDQDGVADGFDNCPETPEGEEVDENGCGEETQQPEGDVTVKHHPLGYWVDHTTGTIIVDKKMHQRVWWGDNDWVPELVIEDIMSLLTER